MGADVVWESTGKHDSACVSTGLSNLLIIPRVANGEICAQGFHSERVKYLPYLLMLLSYVCNCGPFFTDLFNVAICCLRPQKQSSKYGSALKEGTLFNAHHAGSGYIMHLYLSIYQWFRCAYMIDRPIYE